jgi:hypothetical protein
MLRSGQITLHVRFRGGATRTVTLPNPLRSWEGWMTDAGLVGKIVAANLGRCALEP